jgi:hypothetical protein
MTGCKYEYCKTFEDNCIAEVAVKFNACPKPGDTNTEMLESELQTRVDTGVSPIEPFSEDSTKSMLALRMRRSELPAAINKDHCPNAALDDNKFFSFNELCGLNTPDPHPKAGTSDTASSEKTNEMEDDAFNRHPKHLLYNRGMLETDTPLGGLSETVTSSRRETSSNRTDAANESS